ncbi:MAG: Ig-like domain-containing protein [Chlorobium sp.]
MFASSLETTIGFIVNPFELDTALFHIPFINPGLALGTTGWFLTAIEGGVSNLASSNKEPLLFKGGVELQLPEVMVLSVNGELDSKHIAGFVEGTIIDKDAIDFQGQVTLNWNKDYVRVNGSASFAQRTIVGSFDFTSSFNLDFTAYGQASITFDSIDKTLSGNYYINFINDHITSNDYIAAWAETKVHLPFSGEEITVDIGVKYSFNGKWDIITNDEVPLYSSWIVDETINDLIVTVNWDNPVNDVETRVVVYDDLEKTKIRQIINEAEYGEHDIAIINEWSGNTAKVIYIHTPEAGLWDVEVINSDGLGEVVYSATTSLKPLVLTVGELNQNNDQIRLDYTASTPETDGTISFYIDTDNIGYDGPLIESMADPDGNGQWLWNTAGFRGGEYWVYAMLADGKSVPAMSYTSQAIFINNNPVAHNDVAITDEDTPVIIDVLLNDSDFDDDKLTISGLTNPQYGTISVTDDNQILFIPNANKHGNDTFTYTISDGHGGESTALVTVSVNSMPDAPTGFVSIAGHLKQGETLIADTSALADTDGIGEFNYQWYVEGIEISGATMSTYTLTEGEVGKVITVKVSYIDGIGTEESMMSTAAEVHNLTGNITFWKTGEAITNINSTLASPTAEAGTQPIEFRNIQTAADGTQTLEIWETSPTSAINSVQLELALPTGSTPTWQDATALPSGWNSSPNTDKPGQFILGGIGTTALSAGSVKLGTLTLTAPTNPQHFELSLTTGQLGNDTIPAFGLSSDSMTTGTDGLYQHLAMADGTYTLTSAKVSGTAESNAVKANDALAALKIAVGMNPNADGSAVSPYQYLAADVNHDGQVKAADALNILKMAVKLSSAPEMEWLFVPESVGNESMSRTHVVWPDNPIPVTLDIDQDVHLIGIVTGDVDGSWAA